MNGIYLHLGKNVPDIKKIKTYFNLYPWINTSGSSSKDYVVTNSFLINGINGEHFENDEYLIIFQGFIFIYDKPIKKASELLIYLKDNQNEFLNKIDTGVFNIVFFNKKTNEITLINDRFGLLPLYFYSTKNEFVLSSRVTPINDLIKKPLKINNEALKDILTFGYIVGDDTYYKDVKLFPHASILKINIKNLEWKIKRYWEPVFKYSNKDENDLIDKIFYSLKKSVDRLSSLTEEKKICFLSGGLDSRTIYALHEPPIDAATSGFKKSNEQRFAGLVTNLGKKGDHLKFEYSEEIMRKYFLESVNLTEGMHFIRSSYIPYFAKSINAKGYKMRYDGYLGDVIFGGTYISKHLLNPKVFLFDIFIGSYQTPLNPKSIKTFKKRMVEENIYGLENNSFDVKKHLEQRADYLFNLTLEYFPKIEYIEDLQDISQIFFARGRRHIRLGGMQHQFFYDVVAPFFDYGAFDVYLQIPPNYRSWHKIYNKLYKKHFKKYNKIPCTSLSGLKPTVPNFYYRFYTYIEVGLTFMKLKKNLTYLDLNKWLSKDSLWRKELEDHVKYFNNNFKEFYINIEKASILQLIKAASIGAYFKIIENNKQKQ